MNDEDEEGVRFDKSVEPKKPHTLFFWAQKPFKGFGRKRSALTLALHL
jgi:hypothetical protein